MSDSANKNTGFSGTQDHTSRCPAGSEMASRLLFDGTTAEGPQPTDNGPISVTGETDVAGRQGIAPDGAGLSDYPRRDDVAESQQARPTHIGHLTADPLNRRLHNPRNIGMVVDALHKVGAARSIVIDEDGTILAGNGTIEAAAEAGITKVLTVDADGETIIAVRRTGLTPEQKRALSIYDNQTAALATWDLDQLRADADAGLDLGAFFAPAELADLLGADAPVPDFAETTDAEQGRLDQLTAVTCPECGHHFRREELP